MFSRWGAFVYRFRRPVVILTVVLAVASLALMMVAALWLLRGVPDAVVAKAEAVSHRMRGG